MQQQEAHMQNNLCTSSAGRAAESCVAHDPGSASTNLTAQRPQGHIATYAWSYWRLPYPATPCQSCSALCQDMQCNQSCKDSNSIRVAWYVFTTGQEAPSRHAERVRLHRLLHDMHNSRHQGRSSDPDAMPQTSLVTRRQVYDDTSQLARFIAEQLQVPYIPTTKQQTVPVHKTVRAPKALPRHSRKACQDWKAQLRQSQPSIFRLDSFDQYGREGAVEGARRTPQYTACHIWKVLCA